MLAERATLTQADRNLVAVIRKAGEHATGLTQRLIQFSKPAKADAPTIKAVNVPAVLDGLEPLIKALVPATVRVTVQAAHGLPAALTDETVLEQIILNLAINAGQAMPRGGTLHLRGEAVVLSLPKLNLVPGRYVAITVADTGPGMDDGVKSKLFEPYFTTRRTGIGLGLATVKRLVHDAGGAIELDSEPGRGSSFRVLLPAQFIPLPLVQGAGRTVIVADDDAAHRELMKNVLESVGFDVSTAANGDEARQLARWLRDDLDLLVTDVVMPGTNGKKLAEQLRAEWPHLPVVMVSGYPQWEDAPPAATVFLEKPLAAKHLLAAVQSVLNVSA
jgi:CheY-like chemotaxis protein